MGLNRDSLTQGCANVAEMNLESVPLLRILGHRLDQLEELELAEAVFREVGLSRNESAQLVENVLDHISDALVSGEQVKISSFGTFSVRDKSARIGRNPKTGEEVPINPRRVLTFRPSHLMKDRVAAGNKS